MILQQDMATATFGIQRRWCYYSLGKFKNGRLATLLRPRGLIVGVIQNNVIEIKERITLTPGLKLNHYESDKGYYVFTARMVRGTIRVAARRFTSTKHEDIMDLLSLKTVACRLL